MAGISSKAAGVPENKKKKFQGQEYNDDLGVDVYEFKYRMDDPQTGRFWQIDPLASDYVYNSTYAFSENKVTNHVELEGLEAVWADNNVERDVRDAGSGNASQSQLEDRADARAAASHALTVTTAVGAGAVFSIAFPEIAGPIVAAYVFGVPSPTAPTSVVSTVVGETKTVANQVETASNEVSPALSPNVKKVVNTIKEIKSEGGTVKPNPLKPNQEVNMTITKDGQKLDLRIETHPLAKKLGGDGITPQRHMNVDTKPKGPLPNKGHKIIE